MALNVLIVNPGSSGKLIRPSLQARGINCDALFSAKNDPAKILDQTDRALYRYLYQSIDELTSAQNPINYDAVIAGSELGVEDCDILAEKLHVKGNCAQTTFKRRDKFAMQTALYENNLSNIKSYLVTSKDNVKDILKVFDADMYIVKPVNAAGSEGVSLCKDKRGVIDNLMSQAWGELNCSGKVNDAFIIQEYVDGDEYALDFMVINGAIAIMSVCKYHKGNGRDKEFVYKGLELLDPNDKNIQSLIEYAHLAIRALDIVHGPVHMELIDSKTKGPVMIEAATRLHGGVAPALFYECYTPHLLQNLAELILFPDQELTSSCLSQHGYIYFHSTDCTGIYRGMPDAIKENILSLESVKGLNILIENNSLYKITSDLLTCPAIAWFAHKSSSQIQNDISIVKDILNDYFNK